MVRCEPRTGLDGEFSDRGRRASNHAQRNSQTPLGAGGATELKDGEIS